MQVQASPSQSRHYAIWLIALLGIGLLALLGAYVATRSGDAGSGAATTPSAPSHVAYLQFGIEADTLHLASAADPSQTDTLYSIPHAPDYGVVPSVSPNGDRFAYTVLAPDVASAGAAAPAELWIADLAAGSEPRILTDGIDLLPAPLWSPDEESIVYRRSSAEGYALHAISVSDGEPRTLATSPDNALYPVGFTPDGERLYFVTIDPESGSMLNAVDMATGQAEELLPVSDGLTRDWALSPDGSQLAFLAVTIDSEAMSSEAYLLDIASGEPQPIEAAGTAFNPVWDDDGALTVGVFDEGSGESTLVHIEASEESRTAGPETGFDVPISSAPSADGLLVRSFENESVKAPGPSTITYIGADGQRQIIATGEVTFVGWTTP